MNTQSSSTTEVHWQHILQICLTTAAANNWKVLVIA